MTTFTQTHTKVGFANPYFRCSTCGDKVKYWHDPDRCGCRTEAFNYPCKHALGVVSMCPTWGPVEGCICKDKQNHD